MATSAPTKRKTSKRSPALKAQTDELTAELVRYRAVLGEIGRFVDTIQDAAAALVEAKQFAAEAQAAYEAARSTVRELEDLQEAARVGLLRYVSRGEEIMPLFDQMAPADEEVHGANSDKWRAEPIAALKLSLPAQIALQEAEIMLVGQLQDRVLAAPETWFEKIDGLVFGVAKAIEDKLNDFIFERSRK